MYVVEHCGECDLCDELQFLWLLPVTHLLLTITED